MSEPISGAVTDEQAEQLRAPVDGQYALGDDVGESDQTRESTT